MAPTRCESYVCVNALAGLEMLRAAPSEAVERAKPVKISVMFGQRREGPLSVANE